MWDETMRGGDARTESLFSCVSCESRVPKDHPCGQYGQSSTRRSKRCRPSSNSSTRRSGGRPFPPEKLLRALLLQAFYSVRSERQLMEQLDYNLLFRWFTGLAMDAPIWDVTVYTKNRERLLEGEVAAKFMAAVLGQPRIKALLSDEHFSADGTLIEAWASMKSFKPKGNDAPPTSGGGRNRERDFHGEQRRNRYHRAAGSQHRYRPS
jgi:transposase